MKFNDEMRETIIPSLQEKTLIRISTRQNVVCTSGDVSAS